MRSRTVLLHEAFDCVHEKLRFGGVAETQMSEANKGPVILDQNSRSVRIKSHVRRITCARTRHMI